MRDKTSEINGERMNMLCTMQWVMMKILAMKITKKLLKRV